MARARSHASAWAPTDRDTELRQGLANVQELLELRPAASVSP